MSNMIWGMSNMIYRHYNLYLDKFIYTVCQQTKLLEPKNLEPKTKTKFQEELKKTKVYVLVISLLI